MKSAEYLPLICLGILLTCTHTAVADSKANSHSESTDAKGTKVITDEKSEQVKDSSGTVRTVTEHTSTQDPKGVMNKTGESIHTDSIRRANGDRSENVNSVTKEGTVVDYSAEVKVNKHVGGGDTTTITSKEAINPKGLMNEQSAEIKKEVERDAKGAVVSETTSKKIDGKEISEKSVTIK